MSRDNSTVTFSRRSAESCDPADRRQRSGELARRSDVLGHFDVMTNLALLAEAGLALQWSRQVTDPMGHASHQFVLASRD
jgi:hypothetical protein